MSKNSARVDIIFNSQIFYIIFLKSIFDWKFSYVELEEPGQWWEMLQYEPKLGESYYFY